MVTIEQKLLLFSKLLNQSMDKKFEEELRNLEKQYKEKIQKNIEAVDKEVSEIEQKVKIGEEIKISQNLSKSRVSLKKETMALNEKYYKSFISKFKEKLYLFVQSDKYKSYLSNIILKLNDELFTKNDMKNITICLTKNDFEKYSEYIKQEIEIKQCNIIIEFETVDTIIGGLIVENLENNFKVDMTIDSVLEDNKSYIMRTLIESLEAGAYND